MVGQLTRTQTAALTTIQSPDAETMRTIIATVLAVLTAAALISLSNITPELAHNAERQDTPVVSETAKTVSAAVAEKPAVAPAPVPEPPKPKPWAIATSPHARVALADINTALAHLQGKGLTKEGAAYLVGNFIGESYLTPCGQYGDGGQAHGLAQWHPGRRADMPCGLIPQLDWAIDVEMPRDASAGGYGCLCDALRTADIALIKLRTKQWERWGIEGARWQYAASVYSQL